MKAVIPFGLIFCSIILTGCNATKGSGKKASETREAGEFTKIRLESSTDVSVTIGSPQSVVVTADDNLLHMIKTEVSNGTLSIDTEGNYFTTVGFSAAITVPSLEAVEIKGSGDIDIEKLANDTFIASISGSGDIKARGRAQKVEASVNGSGNIDFSKLTSTSGDTEINGSGDITINATATLKVRIKGSGDVTYLGKPQVDSKIKGSGKLKQD